MPSARPQQAAACWLVELGNGDPFLFDLGAGCHERIAAQKIPYDSLDKVFYDGNGVLIPSIPALHTIDGAVSFVLEWNGLKIVYGGDTFHDKRYVEHAKGADVWHRRGSLA